MNKKYDMLIMMLTSIALGFSFNDMLESKSLLSVGIFIVILIILICIVIRFKKLYNHKN